jgi:hypothetical protein
MPWEPKVNVSECGGGRESRILLLCNGQQLQQPNSRKFAPRRHKVPLTQWGPRNNSLASKIASIFKKKPTSFLTAFGKKIFLQKYLYIE